MVIKEKDWGAIKVTEDNILDVYEFIGKDVTSNDQLVVYNAKKDGILVRTTPFGGDKECLMPEVELNGIPVVTKYGVVLASIGSIIIESKGKFYVLNESGE